MYLNKQGTSEKPAVWPSLSRYGNDPVAIIGLLLRFPGAVPESGLLLQVIRSCILQTREQVGTIEILQLQNVASSEFDAGFK